jgi:hypothetical protein
MEAYCQAISAGMIKLTEYMDQRVALTKETDTINQEWKSLDPDNWIARIKLKNLEAKLDGIRKQIEVLDSNVGSLVVVLKALGDSEELKKVLAKMK